MTNTTTVIHTGSHYGTFTNRLIGAASAVVVGAGLLAVRLLLPQCPADMLICTRAEQVRAMIEARQRNRNIEHHSTDQTKKATADPYHEYVPFLLPAAAAAAATSTFAATTTTARCSGGYCYTRCHFCR